MTALLWISAGIAAFAAAMTLLNLLTWSRARYRLRGPMPQVSVIVPARNEAGNIGACIRAVAAAGPVHEIIVYDDGSTDATGDAARAVGDPRVRVLRGDGLPPGWVGKTHACHRAAEAARGDVLLFVDADVRLFAGAVERVAAVIERGADVVTAVPRQVTGGRFEAAVMPLLHLTYTAWFPLELVYRARDPRFTAANGQLLALTRDAYDRVGGFAAVRGEIVDDMALCTRAKRLGLRVRFLDGHELAACRMYDSPAALWAGFSKNLYEGLGESPAALAIVIALYGVGFLLPYVALPFAWNALPVQIALAAGTALRAASARRFGQSLWGVITQPFAVAVFLGIALNSMRWALKGEIVWRGRVYPSRARRAAAAGEGA